MLIQAVSCFTFGLLIGIIAPWCIVFMVSLPWWTVYYWISNHCFNNKNYENTISCMGYILLISTGGLSFYIYISLNQNKEETLLLNHFDALSDLSINLTVTSVRGQSCSQDFTINAGTLESLDFPYPIKSSIKCVWTFNITKNSTSGLVYLNVETIDFNLNDVLTVYDGFKETNYTANTIKLPAFFILNASDSRVTVDFKLESQNLTNFQRFKADFTAKPIGDNKIYYNDEFVGLIRSPIYSHQNNQAQFSWIITQKPDKNVYLAFKSFNFSLGSLIVEDGKIQKNFTGMDLPSDTTFSSSSVTITLKLSLADPQEFELFYSYLYGNCSEELTLVNETEKSIEFKGIPSEFPVECYRIIEGPKDTVLSAIIDWKSFNTTENPSNVIITLADGGSQFSPPLLVDAPVNGNKATNVITKSNKLWIGYSYTSSAKGEFSSVNLTVQNHGGNYYQSGKFGVNETSNVTLSSNSSTYILNVHPNEQIITTLDENTNLTENNRILFYDGGNKEHLITEFTNRSPYFYPVVSKTNKMLIVAEHFLDNDTFEASFIGTLKDYDQLTVLNYGTYEVDGMIANSERYWIMAPNYNFSTDLIALTIIKANLSSNLTLSIYDGPTNTSKLLFNLSNTIINHATIYISSTKGASLTFKNQGDAFTFPVADLSFKIQSKCNLSLDLNTTKFNVISSPAYPDVYPSNAECEWHITSTKFVLLTFKTFDLPLTQPLLIYNNVSTLIYNLSGNAPIDDLIISESHLVLRWSSIAPLNNLTTGKGFEILVQQLDCGGVLNESVKEFATPGYPSDVKNSTLCAWSLNILSKSAQVEIIKLSYGSTPVKSSSAKLTIYEGGSLTSPVANFSEKSESNFLSKTNRLLITYNYTLDGYGGTPYTFTYDTYVCKDLCKNGLCLHDSWRCNGQNDCGDYSDEIDCAASKIVEVSTGVSVTALVISILFCLTLGAVGAFALPILWRRIRSHGRNYQEFRNSVDA